MVNNFNLDLFHKFKAKSLFSHKKATRMLVLEMHPYVEMNLHSNLSFSSFSSSQLQKATTLHTLSLHHLSIGHILTNLIGMKRLKNLNIGKYCSIFFIWRVCMQIYMQNYSNINTKPELGRMHPSFSKNKSFLKRSQLDAMVPVSLSCSKMCIFSFFYFKYQICSLSPCKRSWSTWWEKKSTLTIWWWWWLLWWKWLCRHIPTMTKSHHGGEMSVMIKVGMCTKHSKLNISARRKKITWSLETPTE